MTGPTLKRKGGRPPLPPAPQSAGDCRTLVAAEIVKTKPSERRLRQLYKLLRTFVAAEDAARADAKTEALTNANELLAESNHLKHQEFLRRFNLGPLGLRNLQAENERLKARVAELEAVLEVGVKSEDRGQRECTD